MTTVDKVVPVIGHSSCDVTICVFCVVFESAAGNHDRNISLLVAFARFEFCQW